MNNITMMSEGFGVARDAQTGEMLRLQFVGSGDTINVVVPTRMANVLIDQIAAAARASQSHPVTAADLSIGDIVDLAGYQFGRLPDGGTRLTLHLRTDDGARSLSIDLAPEQAKELGKFLLD